MDLSKRDPIAIVSDERLSREKLKILARIINEVRCFAMVQVFDGSMSEEDLLKKLQEHPYKLVLAPWYRYSSWSKIEAFFGITRNSGPTFAGYFADTLSPTEIGEQCDYLRCILLDFSNLKSHEAVRLVRSLLKDTHRSGMRPLLDSGSSIYYESWSTHQGLGQRIDAVLGLAEIAQTEWSRRSAALRICMSALWSLIYEEGPGKRELAQAIASSKTPRAYFQIGADSHCLLLRLCYTMPGWSPKDAVRNFWPDEKTPTAAAQLLMKFADFVRVHTITDEGDVEVVVGFVPSAPAENCASQMHTLWVDPITPHLVQEVPFETQNPDSPHLKPLPVVIPLASQNAREAEEKAQEKAKERFIFHAAIKIRELKKSLAEREDLIRELRSGGISTAPPLPPPDAEGLLDAFQERYYDSRHNIRQLEVQITEAEQNGASQQELQAIRQKMNALIEREKTWIRKIAATLEAFRAQKRKQDTGSG